MFQSLSQNLTVIFDKIKAGGVLSKSDIDTTLRSIRIALLEGDVALPVVRAFLNAISEKLHGQEVTKSILPAQMIIKIVHDEIVNLLTASPEETKLNLNANPPVNLLIAGLQGSGKTTACAKLALHLKNQGKKLLLVSLDIYRPAALEQLAILANNIQVDSLPIKNELPREITARAIEEGRRGGYDVVIYDTTGRLHIDNDMIAEIIEIKNIILPTETLLVVDAMIGQDAAMVADKFNEALDITGVILSRIDGDARGGAALSIKYITGKPIKFLSTGEKPQDFEYFDARRIASRILDMGDIVSFVEKAGAAIDQEEAAKTAARFKKGKFDFNDYIKQIRTIKKLGGFSSMLSMVPGLNKLTGKITATNIDDKILLHQEAIFYSMTPKERKNPDLLNAARRIRIARGSGTSVQKVNMMLKQFKQINSMMKTVNKMDMKASMKNILPKLWRK